VSRPPSSSTVARSADGLTRYASARNARMPAWPLYRSVG
jgi:hypothetical protein